MNNFKKNQNDDYGYLTMNSIEEANSIIESHGTIVLEDRNISLHKNTKTQPFIKEGK